MKRAIIAALILATLPASMPAADLKPPECPEPARPAKVKTVEEYNQFARSALKYRECLLGYADEHKKISNAHGGAANAAIKRWNAFAAQRPAAPAPKPTPGTSGS
jgi:hypothetical protein